MCASQPTVSVLDGGFRRWSALIEAGIRADLKTLGVTMKTPVIVYCNTGHQASETFFTLKYRLGFPDVRLYNGSWLEWSMTPGTPRETSTPR